MTKPIILANESLVRDGDFENWPGVWLKSEGSGGWLGTAGDTYDGFEIRYLQVGNEASASQKLTVPKNPSAQARYVLSFLCETRHAEAGTLSISFEGQTEPYEISLEPNALYDREKYQARLDSGQPLVYVPKVYNETLDLPFNAGDEITVKVLSPKNEVGDFLSELCITRIKLHLHLEKVVMQTLMLDEQPVPPLGVLPMCLGALASLSHRLGFVLDPDNAWVGTQAALTSDDNPMGAVVPTPAWKINQPVDLPWILDCPLIGDEAPYLFSMNLLNQYTAEPYPVQVSLGHHRLEFSEVVEAAYYPVLEYGEHVRLGVKVTSYYTKEALEGRTVNWTVAGQKKVMKVANTNKEGWAYFDYPATQAGEFNIQASVESPYYTTGVVTQMLPVRVLATDPWKHLLAVIDGAEALWEEKTGYPNRGSAYLVNLKLPADSPLLGTALSLHWSGDPHGQLGVVVNPALETPVQVAGTEMTWTLTCEDYVDGRFYLALVCSKLLRPSPKKLMSLARNLVEVGEVREANKFPVVDENESVLLRVQVVHVIAAGNGDPVVYALVEWKTPEGSIFTITGAGGWASVQYTPTSAGDKVVTASIKAHADAVAVERPFNVMAIATSPWKSEVKIFLNEVEVERNTLGVLCRRGQRHTLKVVPVSGSIWIGKNISLHWRGAAPAIGLTPIGLGTPKPLLAEGVEWTLESEENTSISSLFDLELRLEGVLPVRELSGRLLSEDLTQEVSLMLDQILAALDAQAYFPCLGASHRFSVLPNALSPLVGLESLLTWSGTSAEDLDATVQPALDLKQSITDGGAIWTLNFTASAQPGQFALTWAMPQLNFTATAKPMTLAHNKVRIETLRESPVDPVIGQDPAWQWIQVFSHFTERAVDQFPVTWTAAGDSSVIDTDVEGLSGFPSAPADAQPYEVKAVVSSPFDGYSDDRSMTVKPLASDPWEGLLVSFDDAPAQRWGEKTYFPRRKGTHTIKLSASEDSPLDDRDLILGMTGTGPAELGISFLPEALGVRRKFSNVAELLYTFQADDLRDGSFALRLASERLASLSPANAMSLGEGAQVMKLTWDSNVYQTLYWGQEIVEQVTVLSTVSGKPMADVEVTWRSPDFENGVRTSKTNYYGVASVKFVPKTTGAAKLTATVGDGERSESVALSYFMNEPREIESLTSPKPSGHIGERVSATVNVISPITGKPLQDVEVEWHYPDRILEPTRTDAEGNAQVEFRLSGIRRAHLVATVRGGFAGWEVQSIKFELVPNRSSMSISSTWLQEFTPYVNGVKVKWPDLMLNLFAGESYTLTLDYEYSWLIGDPGAFLALEYKPGQEQGRGLVFDPPLGVERQMAEGTTDLSWTITAGQAHSGPFILQFGIPRIAELPKSPPVPGDLVILKDDVQVQFDSFPSVNFEGALYPCHGATHTLNVRPRRNSQLVGADVQLVWSGTPAEDLEVIVEPPLSEIRQMTAAGLTWKLISSRKTFVFYPAVLQLTFPGSDFGTEPKIVMDYGHNLVSAERYAALGGLGYTDDIKLTSNFTNGPADGAKVSYFYDGGEYRNILATTEGIVSIRQRPGGHFVVINLYDGSDV